MTTVQITLPDQLAQDAKREGLLTSEALAKMLRERLRAQAGDALRDMWQRMADEELTDEQMQEIVAEVKAYRATRRQDNR